MKRRLFSTVLASIASGAIFCGSHAIASERPLEITKENGGATVAVIGDEAAVVTFALAWQESLWPGWRDSEIKTAPTVDYYREYVRSCQAKGEPCCFYGKGKIFEKAMFDAIKDVSVAHAVHLKR